MRSAPRRMRAMRHLAWLSVVALLCEACRSVERRTGIPATEAARQSGVAATRVAQPPPPIARVEQVTPPPPGAGKLEADPVTRAEALILEGKGEAVVALLRPVTVARPDDARAWTLLGEGHRIAGQADAAIAAFDKALALEPGEPIATVGSCRLRAARGEAMSAVAVCARAVKLRNDPDLALGLGVAYMQSQRAKDALPWLERATRGQPDAADALTPLGRTYLYLRDYGKAKDALSRAVRADPKRTLPKDLLARALFELGDKAGARKWWDEVVRADPQNREARRSLAIAMRADRDADEAARDLRALASRFPDDDAVLRELGGAEIARKNWKGAAAALEPVARNASAEHVHLHNLGFAYARLARHDDAVRVLTRAVEASPSRADTRLLLAESLERAGRRDDAVAAYEAVRRVSPGSPEAARAGEGLARLR